MSGREGPPVEGMGFALGSGTIESQVVCPWSISAPGKVILFGAHVAVHGVTRRCTQLIESVLLTGAPRPHAIRLSALADYASLPPDRHRSVG